MQTNLKARLARCTQISYIFPRRDPTRPTCIVQLSMVWKYRGWKMQLLSNAKIQQSMDGTSMANIAVGRWIITRPVVRLSSKWMQFTLRTRLRRIRPVNIVVLCVRSLKREGGADPGGVARCRWGCSMVERLMISTKAISSALNFMWGYYSLVIVFLCHS